VAAERLLHSQLQIELAPPPIERGLRRGIAECLYTDGAEQIAFAVEHLAHQLLRARELRVQRQRPVQLVLRIVIAAIDVR
jgi:hypothetical protein